MTKLFRIFAILLFFTMNVNGQFYSGIDLRIFDNSPFSVSVDNESFTAPSNRILLNNLFPGAHYLIVHAAPFGKWPNGSSSVFFSGIVNLPFDGRAVAVMDEFRRFQVIEVLPGYYKNNVQVFPAQNFQPNGQYFTFYSRYNLLDSAGYQALFLQLQKPMASKEKLLLLKMSLLPNKVNTKIVSQLMKTLDFDRERLDFAIYAFYFVTDKENYFTLQDSFIFGGTAKELMEKTMNLY